MNASNFNTPIYNPKTRILGMTIPQILLLAGIGVVQLIIIVAAVKYIVLAPPPEIIPTVTPLAIKPLAAAAQASSTPTPMPDLSTAPLTIDEMPAGFIPATGEDPSFDFNSDYPGIDFKPVGQFAFYEISTQQYVVGWVFAFASPEEREKFDILVMHPNAMFYSPDKPKATPETLKGSELENSSPIGELSTGWASIVSDDDNSKLTYSDVVLFSHKNFGGIVEVFYDPDQKPVIDAWDVAQKLDNRILDVQVNGPIPTPVQFTANDLADIKLNLEDLPAGFQASADSDFLFNEAGKAGLAKQGVFITSQYGFEITKPNYEEYVIGYTYLFSSTLGKALMDSILSSDEMLNAIYTPDKQNAGEQWQIMAVHNPIGERAFAATLMGMSATGGVRMDFLTFRRGHVGVMLMHGYHTGRWQVTVEDLGVKMDQKIQNLTAP